MVRVQARVRKTKLELRGDTKLVNILRNAISEYENDDGWAHLASCGQLIKKQFQISIQETMAIEP